LRSIAGETVYISSVGSIWENISQSSLVALRPAVEQLAAVWHEVLQPYFLKQPVWLVLAIIGAILMWATLRLTFAACLACRSRERLSRRSWAITSPAMCPWTRAAPCSVGDSAT
jgi:hypothetical protein